MTKDQVIQMAREAGMQQRHNTPAEWWCWEASIERLAVLAYAQGQRDMREAAAVVCEKECDNWDEERPLRFAVTSIRALLIKEVK